MDMNSLAHTKWECKYHIVFAPKFRRKVIFGQIKADVGNILSMPLKYHKRTLSFQITYYLRYAVFWWNSNKHMQRKYRNTYVIRFKRIWSMTKCR